MSLPKLQSKLRFKFIGTWSKEERKIRLFNYTCNAFEVGMCQFSVYRKFKENIEASKKRLVSNIDLTPFKQRELTGSYNQTNINLLNFD